MGQPRKILAFILWLLYGFAVMTHAAHHVLEMTAAAAERTDDDGPCTDCVALGALGLLLVITPDLPAAIRRLAAFFAPLPALARAPSPAPRRRPTARGPPPRHR